LLLCTYYYLKQIAFKQRRVFVCFLTTTKCRFSFFLFSISNKGHKGTTTFAYVILFCEDTTNLCTGVASSLEAEKRKQNLYNK